MPMMNKRELKRFEKSMMGFIVSLGAKSNWCGVCKCAPDAPSIILNVCVGFNPICGDTLERRIVCLECGGTRWVLWEDEQIGP